MHNTFSVFFSVILLLFANACVKGQEKWWYEIQVDQLQNAQVKTIYMHYEIGGEKYTDSLSTAGKSGRWKKPLSQPVSAVISTDITSVPAETVFLANNVLRISWGGRNELAVQYALRDAFRVLTANDRIRPAYFPLYGELNAKKDSAGLQALGRIFDSLKNDDVSKSLAYFLEHPKDALGFYAFTRYAAFADDYAGIEQAFNRLPEWAKNTPDGMGIGTKISGAKSVRVGSLAPDFQQATSSGSALSLSDFRGRYVLLDFWASWCGPCRKQHPALIQVYERFRGKNFEIISVSLDAEMDPWIKAIQKDRLIWPQLSDLKGQQNRVALAYGVQAIPANFLIDPDGKIIGKNLEPGDLSAELQRVLNSSQNH